MSELSATDVLIKAMEELSHSDKNDVLIIIRNDQDLSLMSNTTSLTTKMGMARAATLMLDQKFLGDK